MAFSELQSGDVTVVEGTGVGIKESVAKLRGQDMMVKLQTVRLGSGTTVLALYYSQNIAFQKGHIFAFVTFVCEPESDGLVEVRAQESNNLPEAGPGFEAILCIEECIKKYGGAVHRQTPALR